MTSVDEVKGEIEKILPELKEIRRHLHAHPEIALNEYATQAFVRQKLAELDVTVLPPALGTDVIAWQQGKSDGPNIVLRADMDALPILEPEGSGYRSTCDGLMHACGHDGHMTMLIGAAKILSKMKSELRGTVRYVFQPGEEIVAAGRDLVVTGVLDDPKPDLVLALHNMPGYSPGTFCARPGPFMAAADFFKLTIKGQGGHGSRPETCVDPIHTATEILNALYQLPSRRFSALESVVVSPCMIAGGSNANVIPDEVYIEGTVRYFSKEVGLKISRYFEDVVRSECERAGAGYELDYTQPYMPTINNQGAFEYGKSVVKSVFGEAAWQTVEEPFMGSEDFSFFLDRYPGAMFFIGNGKDSASLHNPNFDFNDDIIKEGVAFFVCSVLMYE